MANVTESLRAHGIGVGPKKGKSLVKFFIQQTQPTADKVGDVWIKTSQILGEVFVSDVAPVNPTSNQVWQQVDRLDYSIVLDEVEAFVGNGDDELTVAVNFGTFLSAIPTGKQKIWENAFLKAYGNPYTTKYFTNNNWQALDAFKWNGSSWVQISFYVYDIYNYGAETVPIVFNTATSAYASLTKESDRLVLNAWANGNGGSQYISKATAVTANKVDVTGFKTLKIEYTATDDFASNMELSLNVCTTADGYNNSVARLILQHGLTKATKTLDVTSLSGQYYIGATVYSHLSTAPKRFYVYKIILEP
jgi:hypothetical protein